MTFSLELRGQRVAVVGLGRSGLGVVRFLREEGAEVVANDHRTEPALRAQLEAFGAEPVLGGHPRTAFEGVDFVVVSPGVPPLAVLDEIEAEGTPVVSEVELASRFVSGPIVGITGTNGKSTVTSLIGAMAKESGRPTFVGGNLGTPFIEVVRSDASGPDGFVVVELSSFQLERVDRFRPTVAVLLNISADHLDRYPNFAAYAAAKGRIFHRQERADHAVVPADDELCRSLARAGAAKVYRFGGTSGRVRVMDGAIRNGASGFSFPVSELGLSGAHNIENACAAALAGQLGGIETTAIDSALRSFTGLPHRMERVGEVEGVRYYNDSKATNVGAALAALRGVPGEGVVWIAGGVDKGGSYAPLREELERRGRGVVLLGEAAELIEEALDGVAPIRHAGSMEEAVAVARSLALAGDAALLAPACSSYDMFRSYAERGDAFREAVVALRDSSREERP